MPRPFISFLLLLFACYVAGCASAEKRFEQGGDLEAEGKFEEAAYKYIDALRKDSDLVDAKAALQRAGDTAVERRLDDARQFAGLRRYEDSMDEYLRIDKLVDAASAVAVALALPADYDGRRERVQDEAIEYLMTSAVDAENEGDYSGADRAYSTVLERYSPNPDQRLAAERARLRLLVRWAEDDLARNQFKSAYDRAGLVIELVGGPDQPAADPALRLQREALDKGTLYVALLPAWRTDGAADDMSSDFMEAFNDALQLDYWNNPPLFIAVADPALVRRSLRDLRLRRQVLSDRQIGQITRDVDADLGMFVEFDRFTLREEGVKERQRSVETSNGVDTTFTELKGRLRMTARIVYTITDERGREVYESRIEDNVSEKFERGEYAGNYRDLKLSRSQRKLFDQDRLEEEERELERELVDKLSRRLASAVYDRLQREVE
ncbi:MAG: hypothetical protein AAGI08_00625 [Bacteroidota bacterium]